MNGNVIIIAGGAERTRDGQRAAAGYIRCIPNIITSRSSDALLIDHQMIG